MTLVTTRISAAGQLAAIGLLLLIVAPWTASFATMQGRFDASQAAGAPDAAESPKDETAELKALVQPAVADAVAATPVTPHLMTWSGVAAQWLRLASSSTNHTQTLQVLRL